MWAESEYIHEKDVLEVPVSLKTISKLLLTGNEAMGEISLQLLVITRENKEVLSRWQRKQPPQVSVTDDIEDVPRWVVRSHPSSDIQYQYPISDLCPLNPSIWSLHLIPGHWTSHSPLTFNHTQLYLGDPSIISMYLALIANVTGFSIVPPFVFPELVNPLCSLPS